MKHIDDIFDQLDAWRHYPAYQLERRADIFFAAYLPDILAHRFGVPIEGVVPEFPIRLGTIHPGADVNQSFKVDYLAKARGRDSVMLVELKTDPESRREKQDQYLRLAKQAGLVSLLEGVLQIYGTTNSRKKYRHLLSGLEGLGLLARGGDRAFRPVPGAYLIEIVYIQPDNPDEEASVVTFREAAEVIRRNGDELSARFAQSLVRWAELRAGEA
jgi:hypothetical protein